MIKVSGFQNCTSNCVPQFSNNTLQYLSCFEGILDRMIDNMTNARLDDSISHNFIVQMIPHHQAAIEMSHHLLQYTTLIPLQDIALDIINEQTKSIQNMQEVLNSCQVTSTTQDLQQYQMNFNEITRVMFSGMRNASSTNNININFMNEMIPHHEGAIEMSQNALCYPIDGGLKPILDAIITSQTKGVRQLKALLDDYSSCAQC